MVTAQRKKNLLFSALESQLFLLTIIKKLNISKNIIAGQGKPIVYMWSKFRTVDFFAKLKY